MCAPCATLTIGLIAHTTMSFSTITLGHSRLARVGLEHSPRRRSQGKQRSRTAFHCQASQPKHEHLAGETLTRIFYAITVSFQPSLGVDSRASGLSVCQFAGLRASPESVSLSLASLLVALSADAATGVQETVQSTAAKIPSPPPASSVLQPSSIDSAVSSVVDAVRVRFCP